MAIAPAVTAYSFSPGTPANRGNPFAASYGQAPKVDNTKALGLRFAAADMPNVSRVNVGGRDLYFAAATTRLGAGSALQLSAEQAKAVGGVAFTRVVDGPADALGQRKRDQAEAGFLFEAAPDLNKIATPVTWKAGSWWRDQGLGLLAIAAAPFAVAAAAPSGIGYGAGSGLKATVATGLDFGTLGTGAGTGIQATAATGGLEVATLGAGGSIGLQLPAAQAIGSGVLVGGGAASASLVKDAIGAASALTKEGIGAASAIAGAAKGASALAADAKAAGDVVVNLDGGGSGGLQLTPADYLGLPPINSGGVVPLDPYNLTAPTVTVTGQAMPSWVLPAAAVLALLLMRVF